VQLCCAAQISRGDSCAIEHHGQNAGAGNKDVTEACLYAQSVRDILRSLAGGAHDAISNGQSDERKCTKRYGLHTTCSRSCKKKRAIG